MGDVLARICADKRRHVAARKERVPPAEIERRAGAAAAPLGFRRALERADGFALIAEIKKASPSRGLIRADFDPPALALAYKAGGAACLSVLTDAPYFQGDDAYVAAAKTAANLPVLRKDFMLDPYQVVEARALGADGILVIMAALDDGTARGLVEAAHGLGMDVLVEVHDEAEMERALPIGADLIGVNNRDLKTLEIDLATTERLAPMVPEGVLLVAESGLHGRADLARMAAAGAGAFLVGESLMRQDDVAMATRRLLGRAA
ncbi:MAG: indole-3-glycerol phosphate synthase TrpC [Geminicoccaceae bacterium]|nr:indole-3-glycerol phosphate synthase TrpC [Geminicoccaceae bacterium]